MESLNYFPSPIELRLIAAYNKAHCELTYIIYTKPEWVKYGGVSSEFIEFTDHTYEFVVIRAANGDKSTVPFTCITIRVQF